jgi:SAM-dependent methyltransferase
MRKIDYEKERVFENAKVANKQIRLAQSKYYWAVEPPITEFKSGVANRIRGKVVVEVGCARGDEAAFYAPFTSQYVGVDLADEAVAYAQGRCIPNAMFIACNAHAIPLENDCCDAVIVNAVLHHLDIETSLKEIARLLKPGGYLFITEPLGMNPLFRLYRWLTPRARTADEMPFTRSQLLAFDELFTLEEAKFVGLLAVGSALFGFVRLRNALLLCDKVLAATPLRYCFWQICASYRKKVS